LPLPKDGRAGTRILVVQNSERAPGGTFCKELIRQGAVLTTIHPADGELLPAAAQDYDGLVVLGGPQHAFDDTASPYFGPLMRLLRDFDMQGKPVAGICLGCQLLARAYGGAPWTMDSLEFGFTRHEITPEGLADPVIGGSLPLPAVMEFHEDSFDLPAGVSLLIRGRQCPHQCFKVGKVSYGFQFHLEVDSEIVSNWFALFREGGIETYKRYRELFDAAYFDDQAAKLPLLVAESEQFCRRVSRKWLGLLTVAKGQGR